MNMIDKIRKEPVKAALLILLVIQFCLIAVSNITLIDKNLDGDVGMLFHHTAEIWRQKNVLLPDWDYRTTLEWDCSSILAVPFYAVTHNIILSFGLSNIVFLICFLTILFFLFKGEDSLYPLLCANLILIPFRIGQLDYYNMLFFGGAQYILKVLVPLLLAGLLLYMDKHSQERVPVSLKFLMAVYFGLLFLCAMSSGVYVLACGIFPIFAAYIGYKFLRWEKVSYSVLFLIVSSVVLNIAGWKINMVLMGGANGNNMTFCSIYQMLAGVSSCFFGIFELYGGTTESMELRILSMEGIEVLAKWALTAVMLVSGMVYILKYLLHPMRMMKKENLRTLLLLSVFVWNVLVLIISFPRGGSATYEYRYHLIGMIPLMCVTVILLIDSIKKLRLEQRNCLYAAGFLAILFLCAVSYKKLYFKEDLHGDLKELCSYTKGLDAEHIYMYGRFGDAEICRVIDETSSYICLLDDGTTWEDNYYSYYKFAPMQTSNVVVVVNENEYQFGDSFEIAGHVLTRFASIGNRSLYYFTSEL